MTEPHPDTVKHIERVKQLLGRVMERISDRAFTHDKSKTLPPEVDLYNAAIPALNAAKYGSPEYHKAAKLLGPAWKHHKENNRHHPEFFENGANDMTLVDVAEMLCDWKAASERGQGNDILQTMHKTCERFGIGFQLWRILENTIKEGCLDSPVKADEEEKV